MAAPKEFQQKVLGSPDLGLAGQLVDGYFVPTAVSYVTDGSLAAGQFAFDDTTKNEGVPLAKDKAATGMLLGVVIRTATGMLESPFTPHSDKYPANTPVAIAARGRVYHKVKTGTPKVGDWVIVDPSNGTVSFNATVTTTNNSGWRVMAIPAGKTTAAENDLIVIENLG